ncbi:TPA: transcriptional regulator TctD [Salmonella enterica]|uniref:Transcriptional regulatory protein TctD n=2 Tax=Salmonella enterica TaxID=28901 RepID=A0A730ZQ35_SALTM|nr:MULTISPECIES: transcriptional regulator TctD [Salmonella]EDT1740934.1 transcriptional regulator TctD [Salmonella enterica subsp. enterica serovar O rough]EEJ1718015.1 transcriptional regulator TctD [Salmonella enterica subsp. salamae]APF14832.1 DNA-binding response regulator [Salmonella enterica subsp. enterica serovar Typhimurium]ARV69043.1 Transcriptional regulatory protein tctD [Salmonella enterica subsp. enterica]EAA6796647.1 transcriptional regulator TctD [Salmonella enterica subsp. en
MRLLLAEDNRELAHWLEKALVQNGFAVDCVFDGLAADHLLHSEMYALAVLDINMPGMDGLEVVQRLRKRGQTLPVLLLTARSAVADRVKGLNVGADDYLPKSFELEELDARLRALLRRSAGQVHEVQQLGELIFHDEGYFLLQGQPLALTPREQALLTVLMYRRTRPVSRQQLFEQVFSLNDEVSPESIELYIHRLRKKLQGSDVRITTLRGLGYVLERGDEVG